MLLESNFVHYCVLISTYLNIFCVLFALILFPLSILLGIVLSNSNFFAKLIYYVTKITHVLFLLLIICYSLGFCILILSGFLESIKFKDALLLVIEQWIFLTIIWGISLLAYLAIIILLLPFGITLLSLSQVKDQLTK